MARAGSESGHRGMRPSGGSSEMQVRFVGSGPSHMMGVVSFTSFGQAAEVTEEQARDLALGGAAIVPAQKFAEIFAGEAGAALAKKHAEFGRHAKPADGFDQRRRAALAAAAEFA